MTDSELLESRKTLRRVLAGQTYVSYGALLAAVCDIYNIAADDAMYVLRGVVELPREDWA
jgi:hypothetical protein